MTTYLSLFSGAGGGDLACSVMMDWRCLGYVENNEFCQRILARRQEDGHLDRAPIFGDIGAFVDQGYAARYREMVDVVVGGFPCQPFSDAGLRQSEEDPRNQWPSTARVLRAVRPRQVLLENVTGLLSASHGYFGQVLRDLAALGYDAQWQVLSAADIGAPHRRKRLWILANSNESLRDGGSKESVGRAAK